MAEDKKSIPVSMADSSQKKKREKKPKVVHLHTLEDLAYGQIVIVTARWILTLSALFLALWNADDIAQLRLQIIVLFLLAGGNFYLHSQILMRRPVTPKLVYMASAGDLAVITILIIRASGFDSGSYVYYFPAILAFSVAFPSKLTSTYVGGVIVAYSIISILTPGFDFNSSNFSILVIRLLMISAIGITGNRYWQIEGTRRQAAVHAQEELMSQLSKRKKSNVPIP